MRRTFFLDSSDWYDARLLRYYIYHIISTLPSDPVTFYEQPLVIYDLVRVSFWTLPEPEV